jgi:hypothetical protein
MMRSLILAALGVAILSACATPAEQAARMNSEMDRMVVVYGPACQKLGYSANSDSWRNCVLQLAEREDIDSYVANAYNTPPFRRHWYPYYPY